MMFAWLARTPGVEGGQFHSEITTNSQGAPYMYDGSSTPVIEVWFVSFLEKMPTV
jgi:hypothetical protein